MTQAPAPQSSRKTPCTDAETLGQDRFGDMRKFPDGRYVPADLCRSMERQRDEARDALIEVKRLAGEILVPVSKSTSPLDRASHIIDVVDRALLAPEKPV